MNNKIFFGLILGLSLSISCTKDMDDGHGSNPTDTSSYISHSIKPAKAKYDVSSGTIFYSIEENAGKGTKKVYFEDFGNKEATEIYYNNELKEKLINKGDGYFYTLDFTSKTAIKRRSSIIGTEQRFDIEEMPDEMKKENHVSQLGDVIIAGKSCKTYSMESGGIKTIKSGSQHIILSIRTEMGGIVKTVKASEIHDNILIPSEIYDIPGDFNLKEF